MSRLDFRAALDILIIATLIYYLLKLLRGTRAVQMLVAIALLVLFYRGAQWARLEMVEWLLTTLLPYVAIALIILFQPEIRRALSRFGRNLSLMKFASHNPKADLRRHRDGGRIFFAESHRRADGRRAAGRACEPTSRAGFRSMPSFPTTCWSRSSGRARRCTMAR